MQQLAKDSKFRVFAGLALSALLLGFGLNVQAVEIRVSQESSAGAGDFDANVLGTIDSFSTALTIAQYYQYGTPNGASYNGELNGGPNPVSSQSMAFFVEAADGLSLVMVHDNPNDGSGGSTQTRWNLSGDTAAFVVNDDPNEGATVSAGGTQFDSTKNWVACCTDGYAIGALEGTWELLGQFFGTPTGITSWAAVSDGSSSIPLALDSRRRVRFDVAGGPSQVPSPAPLALLGLGLAGLGAYRRRK